MLDFKCLDNIDWKFLRTIMYIFSVGILKKRLEQEKLLADDLRLSLEREQSRVRELSQQAVSGDAISSTASAKLQLSETELEATNAKLQQEQLRLVSARYIYYSTGVPFYNSLYFM